MKRNVWNEIKLFALAGVMSLTLLGCGGKGDAKEEPPVQEGQQEDLNTEDQEAPQGEEEKPEGQGESTDPDKQADSSGTQNEEEVTGEITELGDGQFTIKKFHEETAEDGSEILVSPAEGVEDDGGMEFESLTVLCNENTRIYKRTIRDGGASYEDSESSFDKLEKGMEVRFKGSREGDTYRASEVQIVDVIL
ncbi:hypothetical protein IMSAGC007_01813 [Lachnospiraceae bacterium]|nr:hypothetical protein IMSAGC007_01813 [Lachnospiraceae bacterium]